MLACSTWNINDAKAKINAGACGVEITLPSADDDFFESAGRYDEMDQYVYAVHLPIQLERVGQRVSVKDYSIDSVDGWNILPTVCKRAEMIAQKVGRSIIVIARVNLTAIDMHNTGIYSRVLDVINKMSATYPHVIIAIENTVRLVRQPLTNVDVANSISAPNVRTCLDVCNSLLVTHHTRILVQMGVKFMPYEAFYKRMSSTVCLLHLSNAVDRGSGYGIDSGYQSYFSLANPVQANVLERTLWCYKNEEYSVPICINCTEDAVGRADNFVTTLNALKQVCQELNLLIDC